MQNPFTYRNMIKDVSAFFGRKWQIEEIFQNLENFQNTSVVGERRSGKSSLLWHVSQPEVYGSYPHPGEKPFLIVFFDLQSVAALNQKTFFKLLAESLARKLPEEQRLDPAPFDSPTEYFSALIEKGLQAFRIVICLDEFETVAVNEQFDAAFLQQMRSFANLGKVAYITSSREQLDTITTATHHIQGSDFWNIFVTPPTYLGLLTKDEARELTRVMSGQAGLPFDQSETDFAFELSGCHPLFLQIACFHIFEAKKTKREIGEPDELTELSRSHIRSEFLLGATPHFEHIWNRLSPAEKAAIAQSATLDAAGEFKEAVKALLKKELLISGQPFRAFCEPFQQFASARHSPDRAGVAMGNGSFASAGRQVAPNLDAARVGGFAASPPQAVPRPAKLDIWIGRKAEVILNFNGPYNITQFCPNSAKINNNTPRRFDMRVRALPQAENWRLEKQEIGNDVAELFDDIPEISQIYTAGRTGVENDEQLLLTFRSYQELLSFPFEFINCLSSVDEGMRHLVLNHPIRKSILGIRSKKAPLLPSFCADSSIRVLFLSSDVSGPVRLSGKIYTLPPIPGAKREIDELSQLADKFKKSGDLRCQFDVRHDVTKDEMSGLLESGGYDVIHFSGHGAFMETAENSCLFVQGNANGEDVIDTLTANELNILVERSRIKFVYLSCCQGAQIGATDKLITGEFLGIVPSLLVGGVPSVLSMRWPLNDQTAVLLAISFYSELFKGRGIELALFRARKQVQAKMPNDYNWLSPVLVVQGD